MLTVVSLVSDDTVTEEKFCPSRAPATIVMTNGDDEVGFQEERQISMAIDPERAGSCCISKDSRISGKLDFLEPAKIQGEVEGQITRRRDCDHADCGGDSAHNGGYAHDRWAS